MAEKNWEPAEQVAGVPYNESDSDIPRNRVGRATLFFASVMLAAVIPGLLIRALMMGTFSFDGAPVLGFILGMIGGQMSFKKGGTALLREGPASAGFRDPQ